MKLRKIVAILAAALMLVSILPISAFAADITVVFNLGDDGAAGSHKDGTGSKASHTDTSGDYTLDITDGTNLYINALDAQGNGCLKLGTSKKTGGFSFTVPAEVTSVIIAAGKYKSNASTLAVNGTNYALSGASNNGEYDEIVIDTNVEKTITVTTISGKYRAMINSITYVISATGTADCDHGSLLCGDTCPECETYVKEHVYANNCAAECENGCGTANPNYADHVYGGIYDTSCDVCNAAREVDMPAADSELTIAEAIELGVGVGTDNYTEGKYYVTGEITQVYNTTYGNLYLTDGENTITVYGLYDGNGTRYDAMSDNDKPVAGDTIKVYGIIGNYQGTAQMKNGDLIEINGGCEHENAEYAYDCQPTTCPDCGKELAAIADHAYIEDVIDATCTATGNICYECSVCGYSYDEEIPTADHNYGDDDICDACGAEKPNGYAPITSADQLVSGQYVLVVETGYAPTYINDISASSPWLLCGQPEIVDGVIADATGFLMTFIVEGDTVKIQDANGNYIAPKGANTNGIKASEYAWAWSFEDGQFVFAGDQVYLASNTSTGTNGGLNRFRAYKQSTCTGTNGSSYKYKFTLYAAAVIGEPACQHENASNLYTYHDSNDDWHKYAVICDDCGEWLTEWIEEACTGGEATCTECATCEKCGLNYGDTLDHVYFDDCSTICESCGEETREAGHNVIHMAAVAATCGANGNVEYWYCDVCGAAWLDEACTMNTNVKAVKLPATGEHVYFDDCSTICESCGEETREAGHNVIHMAAVAATCGANGNVEYWYCDVCGAAWLDEACTLNTNQKAVKLPATGEHVYDDEYDADCNECGDVREVPEKPVEGIAGDANGDGEVNTRDIAVLQQYTTGWDVTLNEEAADVNGDGEVNTRDIAVLQQYTTGWDVTLGG